MVVLQHDGSRIPLNNIEQVPYYGQFCRYHYLFQNHPLYKAEEKQTFIQNEDGVLTSQLLDFSFFNIEGVRGYYKIEADGYRTRLVNAEDIARGAGLSREKSFHTSAEIRTESYIQWDRFNQYAEDSMNYVNLDREKKYFNLPADKDTFIPLKLAIMVISRCASEQARKFQGIVATVIADQIDRMIDEKYDKLIDDMQGTIEYQNHYLNKEGLFTTRQIAAEFNMTAQQLTKVLHTKGYIYRSNGQWIVRSFYSHLATTSSLDIETQQGIRTVTFWTEGGRLFIHTVMRSLGIYPDIDNREVIDSMIKK